MRISGGLMTSLATGRIFVRQAELNFPTYLVRRGQFEVHRQHRWRSSLTYSGGSRSHEGFHQRPWRTNNRLQPTIIHRWASHKGNSRVVAGSSTANTADVKVDSEGNEEPKSENDIPPPLELPFFFETGYALFAKRPSRPFPPPFLSLPSGSFSDPLSTHDRSRDRRPTVNGQVIRGMTNGDDAIVAEENFIGANDGVGAWATREKGHAALWSRLILHFWAVEAETALRQSESSTDSLDPTKYLQSAFEQTQEATSQPNKWDGTTTACGALLTSKTSDDKSIPIAHITNLGDSQVMVIRPSSKSILYKTEEQWHWFDCPRQLGTNSPDTPTDNAVTDEVELQEDDVVLAMSDGVVDNLWEHEILSNVLDNLAEWEKSKKTGPDGASEGEVSPMPFVAQRLLSAAREIAEDPFAESPFMERAIEEGLPMEGGKLDDISVVVAVCRRRKTS